MNTSAYGESFQSKSENGGDIEMMVRVVSKPTTVVDALTDDDSVGKTKPFVESQTSSLAYLGSVGTNKNEVQTVGKGSSPSTDAFAAVSVFDAKAVEKTTTNSQPAKLESAQTDRNDRTNTLSSSPVEAITEEKIMMSIGCIIYSKKMIRALRDEMTAMRKRSTNVEEPVVTVQHGPKAPFDLEGPPTVTGKPKSQIECNKPRETMAVVGVKDELPVAVIQDSTTSENNAPQNARDAESENVEKIFTADTAVADDGHLLVRSEQIVEPVEVTPAVSESELPVMMDMPVLEIPVVVTREPIAETVREKPTVKLPAVVASATKIFRAFVADMSDASVKTEVENVDAEEMLDENAPNSVHEGTPSKDEPIDAALPEDRLSYFRWCAGIYGRLFLKEVVYPLCFHVTLNPLKW